MRTSDRILATSLAVVVWLAAAYAVAPGPVASAAITHPVIGATAALNGHAQRP